MYQKKEFCFGRTTIRSISQSTDENLLPSEIFGYEEKAPAIEGVARSKQIKKKKLAIKKNKKSGGLSSSSLTYKTKRGWKGKKND